MLSIKTLLINGLSNIEAIKLVLKNRIKKYPEKAKQLLFSASQKD